MISLIRNSIRLVFKRPLVRPRLDWDFLENLAEIFAPAIATRSTILDHERAIVEMILSDHFATNPLSRADGSAMWTTGAPQTFSTLT